jgi:hypothetical protein
MTTTSPPSDPLPCMQMRYDGSSFRNISLRRLLRDSVKRLYFAVYKLGVRLGVYILPAHYYVSEPNIIELKRTVDLWAKPSAMSGVHVDLDEQMENLRRVCAPYQQEFYGNPYYQYATNQPFRSWRSRFFGYIEAQVLHAVIRHYKPARIIEIGRRSHQLHVSSNLDESAGYRCERSYYVYRALSGQSGKGHS